MTNGKKGRKDKRSRSGAVTGHRQSKQSQQSPPGHTVTSAGSIPKFEALTKLPRTSDEVRRTSRDPAVKEPYTPMSPTNAGLSHRSRLPLATSLDTASITKGWGTEKYTEELDGLVHSLCRKEPGFTGTIGDDVFVLPGRGEFEKKAIVIQGSRRSELEAFLHAARKLGEGNHVKFRSNGGLYSLENKPLAMLISNYELEYYMEGSRRDSEGKSSTSATSQKKSKPKDSKEESASITERMNHSGRGGPVHKVKGKGKGKASSSQSRSYADSDSASGSEDGRKKRRRTEVHREQSSYSDEGESAGLPPKPKHKTTSGKRRGKQSKEPGPNSDSEESGSETSRSKKRKTDSKADDRKESKKVAKEKREKARAEKKAATAAKLAEVSAKTMIDESHLEQCAGDPKSYDEVHRHLQSVEYTLPSEASRKNWSSDEIALGALAATRALKDNINGTDQDTKSLTTRVNVYFVYFSLQLAGFGSKFENKRVDELQTYQSVYQKFQTTKKECQKSKKVP